MYMISTSRDYADEFDYPILSLFDEEDSEVYNELKNKLEASDIEFSSDEEREISFGSNEALYLSFDDMDDMIQNSATLSLDEYLFVQANGFIGLDIFEVALNILSDLVE